MPTFDAIVKVPSSNARLTEGMNLLLLKNGPAAF